MRQVPLPEPNDISPTLKAVLTKRFSATGGDPSQALLLQEAGTLLGLSLRERANRTRNYPSGGALYPVETYLISTAMEGHAPGIFHYNPTTHALEQLCDLRPDFDIKSIASHPESLPVSTMVVFTAVWQRSSAKYGDLAYLHALIEAGHMSENILLVGTALGLQVRPYAGFNDDGIIELLDLNQENEQPIHSITLCKGKPVTKVTEPGTEK